MTFVDQFNLNNEKISEVELNDEIFQVPVRKDILHQVVISQMANRRSGSGSSKGRSQVKSSRKKLYRQKGTGRARAGSATSPTRRGGGVAFGPTPRNFTKKVPKKVKMLALRMALSFKTNANQIILVDNFNLPEIKTKKFIEIMKRFDVKKALIITNEKLLNLEKSSRNVPQIKVMMREGLNCYDILKYEYLFLEQAAIPKIEEALVS